MSNVIELKKTIDPELVQLLEETLEDVKSGKLIGVVVLGNCPDATVMWAEGGDIETGRAMLAFEYFKHRQMCIRSEE